MRLGQTGSVGGDIAFKIGKQALQYAANSLVYGLGFGVGIIVMIVIDELNKTTDPRFVVRWTLNADGTANKTDQGGLAWFLDFATDEGVYRPSVNVPTNGNNVIGTGPAYDDGNDRIEVFTDGGTFLAAWGSLGFDDGQFNSVTAVAVGANGEILVTDENHRVQRFACSAP